MSQCYNILIHLQQGKSITPIDALNLFGVFRLSARIKDLRDIGHEIETKTVKVNKKEFASYSILEHTAQRAEIEELAQMNFNKIHTIHGSESAWHLKDSLELKEILMLLKNGYTAIPF